MGIHLPIAVYLHVPAISSSTQALIQETLKSYHYPVPWAIRLRKDNAKGSLVKVRSAIWTCLDSGMYLCFGCCGFFSSHFLEWIQWLTSHTHTHNIYVYILHPIHSPSRLHFSRQRRGRSPSPSGSSYSYSSYSPSPKR